MGNVVYLVYYQEDYSEGVLKKIFNNQENAEKWIDKQRHRDMYWFEDCIVETEVDA